MNGNDPLVQPLPTRVSMEVIVTMVIVSWLISPTYGMYIQPTYIRGETSHHETPKPWNMKIFGGHLLFFSIPAY